MSIIYKAQEELAPGHETFTAMLEHRFKDTPDREAYRYPAEDGSWNSLSWGQVEDEAIVLAAGDALALEGDERGREAGVGGERGVEVPVVRRVEGDALALALDHEAGRDRLHAAGGQALADLAGRFA